MILDPKYANRLARRACNQRKRERGECLYCSQPAEPGRVSCEYHLTYYRKRGKDRYDYRKENGLCTYRGCYAPLKDGGQMCAKHAALSSTRQYEYRERQRKDTA